MPPAHGIRPIVASHGLLHRQTRMNSRTLRLNFPQWQGGTEPAYRFGSELLRWLAPTHEGPEETVEVPAADGQPLPLEQSIKARTALLSQARAARAAIERHQPERIVVLGGDCLVDLAPMAYLNRIRGRARHRGVPALGHAAAQGGTGRSADHAGMRAIARGWSWRQ